MNLLDETVRFEAHRPAPRRMAVAWLALAAATWLSASQAALGGIYCESLSLSIPDPGSTSDDMVITDHMAITDLNVKIVASHAWIGDLTFTLQKTAGAGSPEGPVTLMDRPGVPASSDGCQGNGSMNLILDDEADNGAVEDQCDGPFGVNGPYTPHQPLAEWNGIDIGGTWRLNVSDSFPGEGGTLTQWCLITLSVLDIDGNGTVEPLEDGILILRHGFDFSGGLLVSGAVDTDGCTRCTGDEVKTYLDNLP